MATKLSANFREIEDDGDRYLYLGSTNLFTIEALTLQRNASGFSSALNGGATVTLSVYKNYPLQSAIIQIEPSILHKASYGSYKIQYGEEQTIALNYTAIAASVEAALEDLGALGASDIAVTGGPISSASLYLAFGGSLASVTPEAVAVDDVTLRSGSSTISLAVVEYQEAQGDVVSDADSLAMSQSAGTNVYFGEIPQSAGFIKGTGYYLVANVNYGDDKLILVEKMTATQYPRFNIF